MAAGSGVTGDGIPATGAGSALGGGVPGGDAVGATATSGGGSLAGGVPGDGEVGGVAASPS